MKGKRKGGIEGGRKGGMEEEEIPDFETITKDFGIVDSCGEMNMSSLAREL